MPPASVSVRRARPLLGTFVEIAASGSPRADLDAAIERAFKAVADVHRLMSFHESRSDVSRLNRAAAGRAIRVHPWTYEVMRLSCALYEKSAGVFDIGVADALQSRGLLPPRADNCKSGRVPRRRGRPIELLTGHRVRVSDPGLQIDLGGIAKGFAVDRALAVLGACGVPSAAVNAGGDLAAFGPEPRDVYLRDPRDPCRLLGRVELRNAALASSGPAFDPFRSSNTTSVTVIDPRTRRPTRGFIGATVRAPSCIVADALTKVVLVKGRAAAPLLAQYGAGAMFVSSEGDFVITRRWLEGMRRAR